MIENTNLRSRISGRRPIIVAQQFSTWLWLCWIVLTAMTKSSDDAADVVRTILQCWALPLFLVGAVKSPRNITVRFPDDKRAHYVAIHLERNASMKPTKNKAYALLAYAITILALNSPVRAGGSSALAPIEVDPAGSYRF